MQKQIKKIKRSSTIGLIGSTVAVVAVILFRYLSKYQFYPNAYTMRMFVIMGSVLSVLTILMAMMVLRKQIPAIRRMDAPVEQRLQRYAERISTLYYTLFVMVLVLCVLIVFSNTFQMLMLAIVVMLILVLVYPNMYRIKFEVGIDDATMKELFGDKYIPDEK